MATIFFFIDFDAGSIDPDEMQNTTRSRRRAAIVAAHHENPDIQYVTKSEINE